MANIAIFNFTPVYFNGEWKNLHYYNSIISAFKKRKHNVLSFITNDIICDPWNGYNISVSRDVEYQVKISLRKFKPDLIICFNNSKINIIEEFDCPIAIWEADTVKYFSDKDSIKKNVGRYHFIHFTKNGAKEIVDFFQAQRKNIFYIENATSIQSKKIKKFHDISFIGSLYDPDKFFNLKKSDYNYTDYVSARERKKILLSLTRVDLKIYTNRVPFSYHSLKECNKISDKMVFDTHQIEKVMNQSLISLNHSHHQARNIGYSWRVLDILASNSLLITEKSTLLSEKFGKNIKQQFYSSVYDARKKCEYFLNNKNAMHDLIAEQNTIINTHYRWEDRIKKIEDIFQLKTEKQKITTVKTFRNKIIKTPFKISLLINLHSRLENLKTHIKNRYFMKKKNTPLYRLLCRYSYFKRKQQGNQSL